MPEENTKLWYLSRVNLFRDLPEDILTQIAETSQMRSFEKGAISRLRTIRASEFIF